VGLALGVMLKNFLCHGTKKFFYKLTRHSVADKKTFFFVAAHSIFFSVCGLPFE
jgi:hypothetical protein